MSFTSVGQVLGLQGGTPQLKSGSVFSENLPVTKNLDGSTPGAMLPGLMSGGLASIMQNPLSALGTQLQSTLSGLLGQLTGSTVSSTATQAALTSLVTSVTGLVAQAAYLSGTSVPPAGTFGYMDLVTHASTVGLLGPGPGGVSLAAAGGPLTSGPILGSTQTGAQTAVASLLSGQATDVATAATVTALGAALDAVGDASDAAIDGLRALLPTLAAAGATGGFIAGAVASRSARTPASDPLVEAMDDLLQLVVQPAAYVALRASALAAIDVPLPEWETVAPLLNRYNVTVRAIMGDPPEGADTLEVV